MQDVGSFNAPRSENDHEYRNIPSPGETLSTEPVQGHTDQDVSVTDRNSSASGIKSTAPKYHKQSSKSNDRFPFQCSICEKRFTRSTTLREYARSHNDERPYPCSSCPKAFARLKDRKRHEKLHSGEKRYTCSGIYMGTPWGCGRKFAREDGLQAHLQTKTAGSRCIESWNHN
jgi:uncharacterized Zn-finger protein